MTLSELLIVLTLVAVLGNLAVSSFGSLLVSARMTSSINSLVHHLHLARQKAHVMHADIAICNSTDQRQCSNAANWNSGWLIFANRDQDDPPTVGPGDELLATGRVPPGLDVTANRRAFIMRPLGKRSTNGTFVYCDPRGNVAARAVVISYTGKPRIQSTGAGDADLRCAGADG